eukprot:gnl/TRDRNA2_/TRDRNA2_168384_c1_seq7.p1 gnl/TRDRNA2_/TRDRNA2_168384_c1~~gnl/TRDRNA2_/TRDRNA2_168384_c1_seq7.p1  ORF type:complete len:326 (+),score=108.75 gnl/TRDRNA2_/TRDRNA2_168384_c1_seq7:102-1079(+)
MLSRALIFILAIGAHARNPVRTQPKVASLAVKRDAIVPELRPKSDNKFMHDDYPSDERPRENGLAFEHPYPVVQETHNYDYDYVKDENADNGQWKAQMEYDEQRAKMHKIIKETEAAKREMEEQHKDYLKAKEEEAIAEAIAEKAEKATGIAKGVEEDRYADVEDLRAKTKAAGDEVEKEMVDLEECKKQLKEARDYLEKLLAQKAASDANKDSGPGAVVAGADAELSEEWWEKKVIEEYTEWQGAKQTLDEETAELKDIQKRLKEAEERLRTYRAPGGPEGVDQDQGVYHVEVPSPPPKSGTVRAGSAAILSAMAVATALSFSA